MCANRMQRVRRVVGPMMLCVVWASAALAQPVPMSPVVGRILEELRTIEQRPLWPGFELKQIPVAIYDGSQTYLVGHPSPPAGFVRTAGADGMLVVPGQYDAVRANTSVEIGGVLTATCLATPGADPAYLAAVVAHEAFHVYQRQRYPAWQTNEMHLFTYPTDDATNLGWIRVEAALIERAVAAATARESACLAEAALARRDARYTRIPADAQTYERGVELVEGTASLVQLRAGDHSQPSIAGVGFAADRVRNRAYASGRLIGLLLDRFSPGWERRIDPATAPHLDRLLTDALGTQASGCAVTLPDEHAEVRAATGDVGAFVAKREAARRGFLEAPGWRVIVRAPEGKPLAPQGFDPMNVVRLGGTDVLHTRWIKVGVDGGVLEVLNRRSLSRGAGAHPLFSGFREVVVTGLPTEPEVTTTGGGLHLNADGVTATFPAATLQRSGQELVIVVGG